MKLPKNEIKYCSCLDPFLGLPSLENQSIELGFIDPPFNIDLENNPNSGKAFNKKDSMQEKVFYEDKMTEEEYEKLCVSVLSEMIRICKKVVLYCGRVNMGIYYRFKDPLDVWMYFLPFNTIITHSSWVGRFQPLLVYAQDKNSFLGRPKGKNCKLHSNVIESSNTIKVEYDVIGERRVIKREDVIVPKDEMERRSKLIHPCPIDEFLIDSIISQLKPESFLDPFIGSGTTLRVAKQNQVPYLGYEKFDVYKHDHDFLLSTAHPKKKEKTLQESLLDF